MSEKETSKEEPKMCSSSSSSSHSKVEASSILKDIGKYFKQSMSCLKEMTSEQKRLLVILIAIACLFCMLIGFYQGVRSENRRIKDGFMEMMNESGPADSMEDMMDW